MNAKPTGTGKSSSKPDNLERLQKVLAAGGIGSRRQCEELILEGRVQVDRDVVTRLGTRVDASSQTIKVDGVPLKKRRRKYFAVHKPPGVVSTSSDQWRRTRVIDLVDSKERVFTIGRLDKESSGLILVTNDGELANRLTHPRYEVQKTYHVTVAGSPSAEVIQKLRRGIVLSDGAVKPESVRIKKRVKQSTVLEIVLAEGRNREIRRMLARFDHKVVKLHRIAIGPIRLGELPKAAHRDLTRDEIKKLKEFGTSISRSAPKKKRRTASSRKRSGDGGGSWSSGKRGKSRSKTESSSGRKTGTKPVAGKRSKSKITTGVKMGAVLGGDSSSSTSKPKKKTTNKPKRRK